MSFEVWQSPVGKGMGGKPHVSCGAVSKWWWVKQHYPELFALGILMLAGAAFSWA